MGTELARQISTQHVTDVWNVTSTLAGREQETKEEQTRMRLVCPWFWRALPVRQKQVLPGRRRLPPPGAVSTEARLRLLTPRPSFPPYPRETLF